MSPGCERSSRCSRCKAHAWRRMAAETSGRDADVVARREDRTWRIGEGMAVSRTSKRLSLPSMPERITRGGVGAAARNCMDTTSRHRSSTHGAAEAAGGGELYRADWAADSGSAPEWRAVFVRPPGRLTSVRYAPDVGRVTVQNAGIHFRTTSGQLVEWLRRIDRGSLTRTRWSRSDERGGPSSPVPGRSCGDERRTDGICRCVPL